MDDKIRDSIMKEIGKIVQVGIVLIVCSAVAVGQDRMATVEKSSVVYNGIPITQDAAKSTVLNKIISITVQDVPLLKAVKKIAVEANLEMVYNSKLLAAKNRHITVSLEQVTVAKALWAVLEETGLRFAVSADKQLVLLKRKEAENSLQWIPAATQETITGTVTDAQSGETLPGVNILVKGTSIGASTDQSGNFELEAPSLQDTLVVSFIGYQSQEVLINGRTEIGIQLTPEAIMGEEMVVVGYGTQRRQDLTGSISSTNAQDLQESESTSFDEALQGRVAGMRVVQSSGAPGAEAIIRIRGRTSVQGNNQPLYVIDGVPIGRGGEGAGTTNPLATISPSDIESIDVLKDASATAIYGSRGSNGVILIKTKEGREGVQSVNFRSSLTISEMDTEEPMSASQWVQMANERAINGGIDEPFPNGVPEGSVDTNWLDLITQTALKQDYSLSVSGGDEDRTYSIMGNYLDQEGTFKNTSLERGSFRVNLQERVGNLTITPRLSITRVKQDERGSTGDRIQTIFEAPPILGPYREDGSPTPLSELNQFPFVNPMGSNPVVAPTIGINEITRDRIFGNIDLEYQLGSYLAIQGKGAVDKLDTNVDQFTPESNVLEQTVNSAGKEERSTTHWLVEGRLTYNRLITNNHRVDATLATTWEKEINELFTSNVSRLPVNSIGNRDLSLGLEIGAPQTNVEERELISFLGRINYTFKDRYLLTFSGRRDGSSVFGEANKWGFFPSAALGWRVNEEEFLRGSDWISNLKIRLSWGLSGNQAIQPYQTLSTLSTQNVSFNLQRHVSLIPVRIPNPELKWESTEQFNLGVDLGLFNDRYTFTLDLYNKVTDDLLANVPIPISSGFGSTLRNIGKVRNRGIELDMGVQLLTRDDINYSIGGNISVNRNEVMELAGGSDVISGFDFLFNETSIAREGEPIGSFYGLELDDPPLREDGLFNYVDQNDDGQINSNDRVIIGNPHPDFFYGFDMNFRYKNLSASLFAQGEVGKEIFSAAKGRIGDSMHRGRNQIKKVFENRWSPENPDRNAEFPAAHPNLNKESSSWLIENGSYLRIKSLRISYDVPVNKINLPVNALSVFAVGRNLAVFTPYDFFSPDVQSTGGDALTIGVHTYETYPFSRSISLGVNVDF